MPYVPPTVPSLAATVAAQQLATQAANYSRAVTAGGAHDLLEAKALQKSAEGLVAILAELVRVAEHQGATLAPGGIEAADA